MRGREHSEDIKARVIALLLSGATVMEVSRELGIPNQTVSDYRKLIPEDKFGELRAKKGERLDDLVYQCLVTNLETLHTHGVIVREREYVFKQPAGEMATLIGVMADKTLRLLAATTGNVNPRQLESGSSAE